MSPARRGAPLMFLGAVVSGWIAARVVTYVPLWAERPVEASQALPAKASVIRPDRATSELGEGLVVPPMPAIAFGVVHERTMRGPAGRRPEPGVSAHGLSGPSDRPVIGLADAVSESPGPTSRPLLGLVESTPPERPARDADPRGRRWSGDGWVLLRRDTSAPLVSGEPGYGRSQAGAVLRYNLAAGSGHRPQSYLRASAALSGPRERELAGGLSARPLPEIPMRLAIEARVSESGGGTEVRPAAYVVTELAPAKLPFGAQGELYVQGGYVGGRFATAFVDGQARVERPVAEVGDLGLRVGAGAWGGAQEGASRLDIGPTATLTFRLGDVRARLAADYRFRVAGEAEPASGPALTVSAGF